MAAGLTARYTDAVQRHRDEWCGVVWLAGLWLAHLRRSDGVPLLPPDVAWAGAAVWTLVLAGMGLRIWAAANLEKNRFTRPAGPYRLMRHPLYAGTILISLGYFLSLGIPATGLVLWAGLIAGIFLPVLRKEERELAAKFKRDYGRYLATVPALVPDLAALPAALRTSAATFARAGRNFGLRALWFPVLVPALGWLLRWLNGRFA